ncbi:hypothetical protein V3F56_06245 [Moorellaceae bacterium AZ2]
MPYKEIWLPPEIFWEYKGVKVYHVYKNDDLDQGVRLFWYGLSPQCSDTENSFDVRGVAVALGMPQPDIPEEIAAVIRAAIDRALEGRPEECGRDFARCWEKRDENSGPGAADILAELITPEIRSALVGVLEFCNFAKEFGFAGKILDEMDLSDDAFEEILCLLERLVK